MARIISGRTGQTVYVEVLENIRRRGVRRESRNGPTYDLDDVTIELESPLDALPLGVGRKLNPRIAAAEALQLIGGFSDPEWLVGIAPNFQRYREDDGRFWGAYGSRIANQLHYVADKLVDDPTTRQAVITLWYAQPDNVPGKRDYPCTVAIGFRQRGTRLDMRVTMRSNDVWLGLPYDMFQFAQLQWTLCNVLDLDPGFYVHTAWSMHLYASDADASYDISEFRRQDAETPPWQPRGIGRPGRDTANQCLMRARLIRDGVIDDIPGAVVTKSEQWYLDTLAAPAA